MILGKNILLTSYSQFSLNIQDKSNEAGIEIFSPHYSGLHDGNQITIPENFWPTDYQPVTFHVFSLKNALPLDKSDEYKKIQS